MVIEECGGGMEGSIIVFWLFKGNRGVFREMLFIYFIIIGYLLGVGS